MRGMVGVKEEGAVEVEGRTGGGGGGGRREGEVRPFEGDVLDSEGETRKGGIGRPVGEFKVGSGESDVEGDGKIDCEEGGAKKMVEGRVG